MNFLLPPVCLNCHQPLTDTHQLCGSCWQDLHFITKPYCSILGHPLPFDLGANAISAEAAQNPPKFDRARAVTHYTGTMRELIHKLKYHDKHELVSLLATFLQTSAPDLISDSDTIIPIPLHKKRLQQRRFNQSTIIAKRLSELTQCPVNITSLKRVKKTKSQVGLSKHARQKNLQGAFIIDKKQDLQIKNKTILLLDDVMTTGATSNAAAFALKKAGAVKVNVLCLAFVTQSALEEMFYSYKQSI